MNELQIKQELVKIIEKITGIDNSNIRISYQTTGMPYIEADTDYCFISLDFFNSDYTAPIQVSFDGNNEIEEYKGTRAITAKLVFYGMNSFDYASKVRVMVKDASIMKNLRTEGVYLICDTAEPRQTHILINQQWYEQVFLDLRFYQKLLYNIDRHYIDSAEIKVITDHKEQDINIGGN